jgi:hypothetical protein
MTTKIKRARKGANPNLALTNPSNMTRNKEALYMLANNSNLSKLTCHQRSNQKSSSPWITHQTGSTFGYELSIAKDHSVHEYWKPDPFFSWIHANNAEDILFRALIKLAPLHPVVSYQGDTSIWVSPPPSGSGNTVGIIIGKDKLGTIRLIGTNLMSTPNNSSGLPEPNIFSSFNLIKNGLDKSFFIQKQIGLRMTSDEVINSKVVDREARKYRTMAIYVLAIADDANYFAIDTAVVDGNYPSDMRKEFVGEIL